MDRQKYRITGTFAGRMPFLTVNRQCQNTDQMQFKRKSTYENINQIKMQLFNMRSKNSRKAV